MAIHYGKNHIKTALKEFKPGILSEKSQRIWRLWKINRKIAAQFVVDSA